jgi:hypothetical protein
MTDVDLEFSRTKQALSTATSHLSTSSDPEIQHYLMQFVSVVFYSELEAKLAIVIENVLTKQCGVRGGQFVKTHLASILKRAEKKDIAKLVSGFGDDLLGKFNSLVDDQQVSAYSNLILARHRVGHSTGVEINPADVRNGVLAAEHILTMCNTIILELDSGG